MSKAIGRLIRLKFSEKLLVPTGKPDPLEQTGTLSALGTYSNNFVSRVYDGNTLTFWGTVTTNNYIQITHDIPIAINSLRWYVTDSTYRPAGFRVDVSNDDATYTTLFTGTSSSGIGWKTFNLNNTDKYKYYRIIFTTLSNGRVYLHELQFTALRAQFEKTAFTITGKEYEYVGSETLVDKTYTPIKVINHPDDLTSVQIILDAGNLIQNVEGEVTVSYDADIGDLEGKAGKVASFTVSFLPSGLEQKPNPFYIETDNIIASVNTPAPVLTAIAYHDRYGINYDTIKWGIGNATAVLSAAI